MKNIIITLILIVSPVSLWAQEVATEQPPAQKQNATQKAPVQEAVKPLPPAEPDIEDIQTSKLDQYSFSNTDELNYTLGINDIIEIGMPNHPEMSGQYALNSEGKIQYEFVGDISLLGMNKTKAQNVIVKAASVYLKNPKPIIKIVGYHSKSVYVIGQVARPGKFFMRSETIPVREAIIEAGMPLPGSAMHRARLITPNKDKKKIIKFVDLTALLQEGDLLNNYEMHSGDQLYVPSTQEEMDYVQAQVDKTLISASTPTNDEEIKYTLGPDDVIKVTIQKHPEISGTFTVNLEGKIQMEMVGDVYVKGLSKRELEEKIAKLISNYVDAPVVNVTILEYKSKVYYVLGEVAKPGKYYMRSETLPVREAIIEAGMPLTGSAMHRARLITPNGKNSPVRSVDLNAILKEGDLVNNYEIRPGDQLYVPSIQEEMDYVQTKSDTDTIKKINAPKVSTDEVQYTLGPDDVIRVTVQKHPEISGSFVINLEGKIQMEMVGDIYVKGLTKGELEEKIAKLISNYVDAPDVSITIEDYRSKVYYVLGEVGHPGKYYMRSESITVREALIDAGLPLLSAAMRKSRLISPAKAGKTVTKDVDLYAVLYGGNLDKNIEMRPGDQLYVPSTVMAKVFRVVAPVTEPVTSAASAQTGITNLGSPTTPK